MVENAIMEVETLNTVMENIEKETVEHFRKVEENIKTIESKVNRTPTSTYPSNKKSKIRRWLHFVVYMKCAPS